MSCARWKCYSNIRSMTTENEKWNRPKHIVIVKPIKCVRTLGGGSPWCREEHPQGLARAHWPIMRTILQRSALE